MRVPVVVLAGISALCLMFGALAHAQLERASLQRSTLDEYHTHLNRMQGIVQACNAQRTASACDPDQVGPDDEVVTSSGLRSVHYAWLREVLQSAGATNAKTQDGKKQAADDSAVQLNSAAQRLIEESRPAVAPSAAGRQIRDNLNAILAQREFRRVEQSGLLDRAKAAAWRWLFERLSNLTAFGGKNPWLARILTWLAIAVPCGLLLWWFVWQLRNQKAAIPPRELPEVMAPSSREWQRWMQDADRFAREGNWREAVHHIYWAAISRMEAHGLWPADRARTPREYLALLHWNHNLLPDLRRLTRSFEQIWYGHRPAEEQQYREARMLMERLSPR